MCIVAVDAFPACDDSWKIIRLVCGEFQRSTFLQMEIDIAFQGDRSGVEVSGRDDDGTSAGLVAGQDGQIDGFMVQLFRVAGYSAEVRNAECPVGELCLFDVLHDLFSRLECFFHRLCQCVAGTQKHGQ